ncbi:inositol monophosphatase family protein [Variovorax sp. PCZ-1]|uniref:inositol monophosphatase family protein n=1 Tax=Variovorax sp. PCZ-1 TaxID=2835533 RepID=UPI001BD0BCAF|nr:inositol monophosphatase family protein [Variovorax sp. PCZ-1]MBS7806528.1 inositol monophosphatase [Variovorax sp. PCZ-1]
MSLNAMNLEALCADSMPAISHIGHEIWLKNRDLKALQVNEKSAGDVATDIDLWAEQALREKLLSILPGSQFMGEETGGSLSDAPTWIVDPIDGTANFARGYPQWSVSVALAVGGDPVLGIIADPNRQELFYATRGQGAWLKSSAGVQRLASSSVSEPLKAIVSTVFPKPLSPLMQPYLAEFAQVIRNFGQVRRSGSMALELAYVAAGRADAFWERGMSAWDAAAGLVLLREAEADIVAMDDLPLLSSQWLAAGSAAMLPSLVELLRSSANPT